MSAQKETTLSKDTKINLGLVILLIGSIIGGAFWIKDSIAENTVKLLLVEHRLATIEQSISNDDHVNKMEFTLWKESLAASNPSLKVPGVSD